MKILLAAMALMCAGCTEKKARFELHSAEVRLFVIGKTNAASEDLKTLFKIDNQAGRTWLLIGAFPQSYWYEISDQSPQWLKDLSKQP